MQLFYYKTSRSGISITTSGTSVYIFDVFEHLFMTLLSIITSSL
ncbi:protein of unknown function [Petrocella atlantisensis]|uniref:Uncharacterized protein n=1 Tax=Petrocella atlantisensis TaxID=2173034 RepID=A0A3P7S1R5_9FIRM|nr:protein of unknown function [Petrocella atlantisensis]